VAAQSRLRSRHLVLAVAAALALALVLIGASRLSADSQSPPAQPSAPAQPGEVAGAREVTSLLAGIPQAGTVLGRPDAPVTLVEYADLQCPYCAQWALGTFPALVQDYVRAGKLRVEFRGLAFLGADSDTALRATLSAGRQDKLWSVLELLYANQGAENSGWVTEGLIAGIAASVPGLDSEEFQADRQLAALDAEMAKAQAQAQASGVTGTPAFELGRTGGKLRILQVTSLEPAQFRAAIEALLAG
jgi:protein-disulfide isomerase